MRVVVVCTGGGIGDAFLATPVMRALRTRYEHVTALTAPAHVSVISPNAAHEVWSDDTSFRALVERLRAGNFDAAVVTWATARVALALAFAGIAVRVGQSRRLYSSLFTHRIDLASELGDHTTRWAELLLDYARVLGCEGEQIPVSVVDEPARARAMKLLTQLGIGDGPFLMLHPTRGISSARHAWPASGLARVGSALLKHFHLPLLISGSEAEREMVEGIAHRAGGISIAGLTSLPDFAALAERAKLVVAMDSGPMHLAAATGAPTVGIFAMRPDEPDRWHPIGPHTAVVRSSYPCPAKHTKENCPNFACVRDIDTARVIAVAAGLLGHKDEHSS